MLSRKFTSAGQLLAGILGLLPVLASPAASAQEPFIGEVRLFAATYCPQGWMEADGSQLSIWQYQTLYSLLGTRYGGVIEPLHHIDAMLPGIAGDRFLLALKAAMVERTSGFPIFAVVSQSAAGRVRAATITNKARREEVRPLP